MSTAFFNAISGMNAFERALDLVSNNVANMNTPGYHGQRSFFRSIGGERPLGVSMVGSGLRMSGGDVQQTGNPTDVALNGTGFFVLKDKQTGQLYFTRAGQFEIQDNTLVDAATGYEVMMRDSSGNLVAADIGNLRTLPPEATTAVSLRGRLDPQAASTAPVTINNISVFDPSGARQTLRVVMTRDTASPIPNTWKVAVINAAGQTISSSTAEVRYDLQGRPVAGANTVTVTLTTGSASQQITFNFGTPGQTDGTYQSPGLPATQYGVEVRETNGHGIVGMTSATFDENGELQITYGNGERRPAGRLALAAFTNESELLQRAGGLFQTNSTNPARFGYANEGEFGSAQSGALELSNIELTDELGKVLQYQRGFQGCSRVMNVADGLVKTLLEESRGG